VLLTTVFSISTTI